MQRRTTNFELVLNCILNLQHNFIAGKSQLDFSPDCAAQFQTACVPPKQLTPIWMCFSRYYRPVWMAHVQEPNRESDIIWDEEVENRGFSVPRFSLSRRPALEEDCYRETAAKRNKRVRWVFQRDPGNLSTTDSLWVIQGLTFCSPTQRGKKPLAALAGISYTGTRKWLKVHYRPRKTKTLTHKQEQN